jgi:hypothetical protein
MKLRPILLLLLSACAGTKVLAQDSDMLKLVKVDAPKKEYVYGAFKSPRVIMSHSIEMIKPGVMDFRILHRFGDVNSGLYGFFGMDQAEIRLGLDYGITNNLSVGIGRASHKKELDGFLKYRLIQQSTGPNSFPLSVIVVAGMTAYTQHFDTIEDTTNHVFNRTVSDRLAYYWQALLGRKFSEKFTLQLMPTFLHRNRPDLAGDDNDNFAMGIAGRLKLSRRVSFNVDYYYVPHKDSRDENNKRYNPLSVGFDIETGGHVFQLHFTNAHYMNERAFIMETESTWSDWGVAFGFNISRSFQIRKKKG